MPDVRTGRTAPEMGDLPIGVQLFNYIQFCANRLRFLCVCVLVFSRLAKPEYLMKISGRKKTERTSLRTVIVRP